MLEINNSTNGNLVINMSAGSSMEVDLYDDEMDLSNSYTGTSIAFETNGAYSKYYIRVNYVISSSSGNVSTSLIKHNHSYVIVNMIQLNIIVVVCVVYRLKQIIYGRLLHMEEAY